MENQDSQKEMSFLGHLEELRWRLMKSAIAILIMAVILFYFTNPVIEHVYLAMSKNDFPTYLFFCKISSLLGLEGFLCANDIPIQIQSIEMTKQFSTNMYFAIVGGIVLVFPFIFHQFWSFLKPGLKENEINVTRGVVFFASILFFIGVLFGYYVISPLCVQFFGGYKLSAEIQNNFTISSYMSMITTSTFFSGLFFELPVVIYILSKLGIVSSLMLRKYRKHALVGILLLSAIITPPDVISQVLVSIPILLLYEVGIGVAKLVEKKKEQLN
tara:strand:+ start:555 stop:1370 length:816 start_codon:yes stop_codon:yes gene_type:complete